MIVRGAHNLPMKDSLSLAFYNVPDGAQIELNVKDKAGKKKWEYYENKKRKIINL
jgi:hypothetical protein